MRRRRAWGRGLLVGGAPLIALAIAVPVLRPAASASSPAAVRTGEIIVVQTPPGTAPAPGDPAAFRDPVPVGSRLLRWNANAPDDPGVVLTEDFVAAGMPALSADGRRLLFSARRGASDRWSVYEMELPDGTPRRVTPDAFHALHPDWIAGDRIVFASDRDGGPDPIDGKPSFSLYTCDRDGADLQRITFHPASETEPTVLRDGRVLFSSWQPPGDGREQGSFALFTVRNDGTGILPFHGSHEGPARKGRPRELDDGHVAYLAADGSGGTELRTVALRRPMRSQRTWRAPDGFSWLSMEASGPDLGSARSILAGLRPGPGRGTGALHLVDPLGEARLLFDDPDRDELAGVPIRTRPRPRGLVSDTRPGSPTGMLLCLDARRTDRTADGHETQLPATAVRIYRADAAEGSGTLVVELPLEADGSFLADVPADTPLRFETIDAAGHVLLDSKGWVWLRGGEQRACIGCHEDRETAPANRVPMAVQLRPEPEQAPAPLALEVTR